MPTKTITIEELSIELPAFDIDVDWTYSFTPGRYSGPPEDCYPDDEEMEADGVDIFGVVDKLLADPRFRATIYGAIEDHIADLVLTGDIRIWANEEAEAALEAKAEAAYQDRKERGY